MQNVLNEIFNELVGAISKDLMALGFIRRDLAFRIIRGNNCGIIEFQKSVKNSKLAISFTINLAVVCGDLTESGQVGAEKKQIFDAPVRERIGMLLPDRNDKWWEINELTSRGDLVKEVSEIILEKAVPFIERYLDTNEIIDLWESGRSPGLTEVQRKRFLARLKGQK